jgi:hypothetical protein
MAVDYLGVIDGRIGVVIPAVSADRDLAYLFMGVRAFFVVQTSSPVLIIR